MKKKIRKFENHSITRRLYLLFSLICLLFLVLIARLGYMQITHQAYYTDKLAKATKKTVKQGSVRGQIYDASGKPLVENVGKQVLTFTRDRKMTAQEMRETAGKLLQYVDVENPQVTERQEVDYYLANTKVYQDEKKIIYLYSQMNAVENFATGIITTQALGAEQIATIAADSQDLPGIAITTSWDRKVLDTPLASIIGNVSTEQAGLPAEEVEDYVKKGYALNDRVGTSYLEKEYENVLQGKRSEKEILLDKNGNMEKVVDVSKGAKGENLKLSIDLDFQKGVEDILRSAFSAELQAGNATYSEGVYAVAGSQDLSADALGTVTNVFVPGSVVKGATLTSGWENGAISGNQVLTDQPIVFAGSAPINSWFTQYGSRSINAVEALEYSSNTYMVQIALKMMGQPYTPNMTLQVDQVEPAMKKLRSTFAEYGLGTSTGIDLPNESTGFIPKEYTVGNYLTNAFGQFDNYTPMQLAQYAATVANDGKRVSPHVVEGIYDNNDQGGLGQLKKAIETKELNQVHISEEDMALIKQGFYQVANGTSGLTTGKTVGQGASVSISAKTGTAETTVDGGKQAINTNVVAYAPSNNPKIAVAVVFPHNTNLQATVSHSITRDIINLYNQKHPMN